MKCDIQQHWFFFYYDMLWILLKKSIHKADICYYLLLTSQFLSVPLFVPSLITYINVLLWNTEIYSHFSFFPYSYREYSNTTFLLTYAVQTKKLVHCQFWAKQNMKYYFTLVSQPFTVGLASLWGTPTGLLTCTLRILCRTWIHSSRMLGESAVRKYVLFSVTSWKEKEWESI